MKQVALLFLLTFTISSLAQESDCEFLAENFEERLHMYVNNQSALKGMEDYFGIELTKIDEHFPGANTTQNDSLRGSIYTKYLAGSNYWTAYWTIAMGNGKEADATKLFTSEELSAFNQRKKNSRVLGVTTSVMVSVGLGIAFAGLVGAAASMGEYDPTPFAVTGAIVGGIGLVSFAIALPMKQSLENEEERRMLAHNQKVMRHHLNIQCDEE